MIHHLKFTITILLISFCCSTISTAQQEDFSWALSIKSTGSDFIRHGIITDKEGNIYMTGQFGGSADFDPGPGSAVLTANGFDMFIAKYDANGNYLWAKKTKGTGTEGSHSIALDADGNIYVAGRYNGNADFETGAGSAPFTTFSFMETFFAKYDKDGNYVWAKTLSISGFGFNEPFGIDIDTMGHVYITGELLGSADFDPGAGTAILMSTFFSVDIFIAKYDTAGNYVWAHKLDGTTDELGYNIVASPAGNIYITGAGGMGVDFDPGAGVTQLTGSNVTGFVAKYDTDGNYLWVNEVGVGNALALDEAGNVYVTGHFNTAIDFDPGAGTATLTPQAASDIFVAKYDSSGSYIWAKNMGGNGDEAGFALCVQPATGHIYVTGMFTSPAADFDPGPATALLTSDGSWDIFIARYDTNGNYVWAQSIGGPKTDVGREITVNASGTVYVAGEFKSTVDFDFGPGSAWLSADTSEYFDYSDIFLMKLSCNDTSSYHIYAEECLSNYTLNGETFDTSGIYTRIIPNIVGCDSTIVLNLTFYKIEPIISVNGFTLLVDDIYSTYQWIKDGTPIPDAINHTLALTENGDYQVKVTTETECEGISPVYTVDNVSISNDMHAIAKHINIYPNPTNEIIYIKSPVSTDILLTSIDGKVLFRKNNAQVISLQHLTAGVYFAYIRDKEGKLLKVEKVVKN